MYKTDIPIIFEDNDLLVVDKPSGYVMENEIVEFLSSHGPFDSPDAFFNERKGVVHRLDKETSGVLVFAKNAIAFENLLEQFKKRRVAKEYLALVYGDVPEKVIEIDAPIDRNPNIPSKFAVVKQGRSAKTRIETDKKIDVKGEKFTFVRVYPKTGRTHQIRVHLASINHPVAGDYLYLGNSRKEQSRKMFQRAMLHAHKIQFTHPGTHERVEFVSNYPPQFQKYLNL